MHLTSITLLCSALFTAAASAETPAAAAPPAEDRTAILGMAGEFKVTFHFEETVGFQPGYELKKPYTEDAHELVLVAHDEPRRIELQHLLIAGGHVIKHWRQVWTYEDTRVCEFQGNNTWRMRDLTPEQARGTWTQQVTQVDDSPRYESPGRWTHIAGVSTWTSGDTWRPLPRRESKRKDEYQVIGGTNRHVLTPDGWVHEQDNTKLVIENGAAKAAIAREIGVNTYRRLKPEEKFDFAAAREMWNKDGAYWNRVLNVWINIQAARPVISVESPARLRALHEAVQDLSEKSADAAPEKITETIQGFLAAEKPQG